MRMSVSILTPNAFSMRSAMVLDKSERPLRNDDNVGRDTPSAVAAAPTVSPERLDYFRSYECTGVRRVEHTHAGSPD